MLVTNRHVVEGFEKVLVRFIAANDDGTPRLGESVSFRIDDLKDARHFHPNQDVDIAVVPLAPILRLIDGQGKRVFYRMVDQSILPSDEDLKDLSAIEEVVFIGYPKGIFDKKNLLPVARRGITATPMHVDYNGLPTFLIDASVFPGSSGSPVFIAHEGAIRKGKAITIGARAYFLGVVASAHYSVERGHIIIESTPTGQTAVPLTQQLLNLGIVFKASTVLETIEDFVRHRQPNLFES